jgi:hypothetical protein
VNTNPHNVSYRVRPATLQDLDALLALKSDLMFAATSKNATSKNTTSTAGGFLLGSTPQEYSYKLSTGLVWVLEGEHIEGLALVLGDHAFRESEIWQRRDLVRWDTTPVYEQRFAYFDQLAVRPGPARTHVPLLALIALLDAYMDGVDVLISTTVKWPIKNLSAVPYLTAIGGQVVGEVDETYPDFGDLISNVWRVDRSGIRHFLDDPPTSMVATVHRAREVYEDYRIKSTDVT